MTNREVIFQALSELDDGGLHNIFTMHSCYFPIETADAPQSYEAFKAWLDEPFVPDPFAGCRGTAIENVCGAEDGTAIIELANGQRLLAAGLRLI